MEVISMFENDRNRTTNANRAHAKRHSSSGGLSCNIETAQRQYQYRHSEGKLLFTPKHWLLDVLFGRGQTRTTGQQQARVSQ